MITKINFSFSNSGNLFAEKCKYLLHVVFISLLFSSTHANAQNCICSDMIYLNDVRGNAVHKFQVMPDGSLGEIFHSNGGHWLQDIKDPHGIAFDINGYLYIGERDQEDTSNRSLWRVTCDGDVIDDDIFGIERIGTNFLTIDNVLYSMAGEISKTELCEGADVGGCSIEDGTTAWDMAIGPDGNIYYGTGWVSTSVPNTIRRVNPDCSQDELVLTDVYDQSPTEEDIQGMIFDEVGNFYVVLSESRGVGATRIQKYDPNFNLIGTSAVDATLDRQGYYGARGLIYSEASGLLYLATLDDCVAVFDTDLNYLPSLSVPYVPTSEPKAIGIIKECCPASAIQTVELSFCPEGEVRKVFLNELFPCEGIICSSDWMGVDAASAAILDMCDQSISNTAPPGCYRFVKNNEAGFCGDFELIFNLDVIEAPRVELPSDLTVCVGGAVNDIVVSTDAVAIRWQMSTTSCDGPWEDIPGVNIPTLSMGTLDVTTYFRVVTRNNGVCTDASCDFFSECITITIDGPCCTPIGGEIFLDENNDGCQESNEPLVAEDVTVELFVCDADGMLSSSPVASSTTSNGQYTFGPDEPDGFNYCPDPNLDYVVSFELSPSLDSYNFSSNMADSDCISEDQSSDVDDLGDSDCIDISEEESIDAGIYPCATIGGEIFDDANNNGCQDEDEVLVLESVEIQLFECDGNGQTGDPISSTMTMDGSFSFGGENDEDNDLCLDPSATYSIQVVIPNMEGEALEGYMISDIKGDTELCGDQNSNDINTPDNNSDCTNPNEEINIGIHLLTSALGDTVWEDLNGNGIQDPNEEGVENIMVTLYNANNEAVADTITDGNGFYIFEDIIPGDYYVSFDLSNEYSITIPNRGGPTVDSDVTNANGPGTTNIITLPPDVTDLDSGDAGIYICARIGELVWYDQNLNDIYDANENGINGIKVNIYRLLLNDWVFWESKFSGGKPGTASDDGYFKFCVPPGVYYLEFVSSSEGLVPVVPDVGDNDNIDSDAFLSNGQYSTSSFVVQSGEERCDFGIGYYPMASIGDFVWVDTNFDGIRQSNEAGLSGVLVEAFDESGLLVGNSVTDENGEYMIDELSRSGYYLRFTLPTGYVFTSSNTGEEENDNDVTNSNGPNTTETYYLEPGQHLTNIGAGVYNSTALPLNLKSLNGRNKVSYNELTWETANEVNVDRFIIHRMAPRTKTFTELQSVKPKGAQHRDSQYTYHDTDVSQAGTYYYRLVFVDIDGSQLYSNIIGITAKRHVVVRDVYPNPAAHQVYVDVENPSMTDMTITIHDTQGVKVQQKKIGNLPMGQQLIDVGLIDVPSGVYIMRVVIGELSYQQKLVVIKD